MGAVPERRARLVVGLPVRPRRVMFSAILWTILAVVAGFSAVVQGGVLSVIIAVVAVGVALWFWRTYLQARQRPEPKLAVSKKRRR